MEYLKYKFDTKADLIDIKARLNIKELIKTPAAYKYYYRINPYGKRDKIINNRNKLSEYLRCSQIKDQGHIVQYKKIEEFKNTFIIDIHKELKQYEYKEITNQELRAIVNDIR